MKEKILEEIQMESPVKFDEDSMKNSMIKHCFDSTEEAMFTLMGAAFTWPLRGAKRPAQKQMEAHCGSTTE
ncbi:hypothetical protein DPEC_G00044210, partial [Dallia pectoralis]